MGPILWECATGIDQQRDFSIATDATTEICVNPLR